MKICINQEVELESEDLAKAMSVYDMLNLITEAANHMAEHGVAKDLQRKLAAGCVHNLSENAKRFLAEMFAAEYCKGETK